MRHILLSALLATGALAAESAAEAALVHARTPGAEAFELARGKGRAVVSKQGAVFLTVRKGRVRVVDLPGGKRPEQRCNRRGERISSTTTEYRGRDLRCRVASEGARRPWQVIMRGRGIFASGVVRGSLTLDGRRRGPTGVYRIGGGPTKSWPRRARTFTLER